MANLNYFIVEDIKDMEKVFEELKQFINNSVYPNLLEEHGINQKIERLDQYFTYWSHHAQKLADDYQIVPDKYQAITNNNADYFVQGEQDDS